MNEVKRIKHESAQERAIYNSPDNVFNWSWPKVPRHKFLKERKEDVGRDSRLVLCGILFIENFGDAVPNTACRDAHFNEK